MQVINLECLDENQQKIFNKIFYDNRKSYVEIVDEIGKYNDFSLSYLLCSTASRDMYSTNIYEKICKIIFVTYFIEEGCDKFYTNDSCLAETLDKFLRSRNVIIKVKHKSFIKKIRNYIF